MLALHQYSPCWSVSSGSPFCTKVEAYLRIHGIPYTNVYDSDPRKAPRKQMPYLINTQSNEIIPDSECIIDYLEQHHGTEEKHLSDKEKAEAQAWVRCFEHHTYWCLVYTRWMMPDNWTITEPVYFGALPKIARCFVPKMVKKGIQKALYKHGLGRHDEKTLLRRGTQDIHNLAAYLGERSTLVGKEVTRYDISLYALLSHLVRTPIESPLKDAVLSHDNLMRFIQLVDDLVKE